MDQSSNNLLRAYVNGICALSEYEKNFIIENMPKSSNYSAFSQAKSDACLNFLGDGFHERFSRYLIEKFLKCIGDSPGLELPNSGDAGGSCQCNIVPTGNSIHFSGATSLSSDPSPLSLPILLTATSGYSSVAVDNTLNKLEANKLLRDNSFTIPNNQITPEVLKSINSGTMTNWVASSLNSKADVMPMIMFKFLLHMLINFSAHRIFEDFYANLVDKCPASMSGTLPTTLGRINTDDMLRAKILEQATNKSFTECESACSFLLCNLPIMGHNVDAIMQKISLQMREISS